VTEDFKIFHRKRSPLFKKRENKRMEKLCSFLKELPKAEDFKISHRKRSPLFKKRENKRGKKWIGSLFLRGNDYNDKK